MSTLPTLQRMYLYAHLLNQDLHLIGPPMQSAAPDVQDAYHKLEDELGALRVNLPHALRSVSKSMHANGSPSDNKRGRDIARSPTLESNEEGGSGGKSEHMLMERVKSEDIGEYSAVEEIPVKKRRLWGNRISIDDPDNNGNIATDTAFASKAKIVEERVSQVVKDMARDALTPADLCHLIVSEDTGIRITREDVALARLVRGVQTGSRADWEAALKPIACTDAGIPVAAEWIESCSAIDKLADPAMRLVRRYQTLDTMAGDAAGTAYIYSAMQAVEALKFASEWNTLKGPGCLTVKKRFTCAPSRRCRPTPLPTPRRTLRRVCHSRKFAKSTRLPSASGASVRRSPSPRGTACLAYTMRLVAWYLWIRSGVLGRWAMVGAGALPQSSSASTPSCAVTTQTLARYCVCPMRTHMPL